MEIYYERDPREAERRCRELLQGRPGLIVVRTTVPCVWTGKRNTFDREFCGAKGIPAAYGEYLGGSIVCQPGDLSVMLISWGDKCPGFAGRCMDAAAELLTEAGAEVRRDSNDLLADGKKIASWARATTRSGWVQTVAHFSVNTDLELIKRICTKPMRKVPGQLSDYGITAEDILGKLNLTDWSDDNGRA